MGNPRGNKRGGRKEKGKSKSKAPVSLAFRTGDKIGLPEAEDDRALFADCFVDTGAQDALCSLNDPRCIVVGRTGVGKSALIEQMSAGARVITIEPANLALEFISNSNVLSFFQALGVNVDVFYKLLWRHCFCVELLRRRFETVGFFTSWFERHGKYKDAYRYLDEWGDSQLWNSSHLTNTIVTGKVEKKIRAELGAGYKNIKLSGEYVRNLSTEERKHVENCAKKVISQAHSKDLQGLLQLVDEALDDDQKPFYILIDKLDEDWVENDIRFRLIHALIETARKFREIKNAKVILTARVDLLQTLAEQVQSAGFQAEKWKSNYLEISWSRSDMTVLLDKRISKVLKSRYSSRAKIGHVDVLPGGQLEYMMARTLDRPRDLIEYFNICMKRAGASQITPTIVKEAEREYSRERLLSVRDEWKEQFPAMDRIAKALLQGKQANLKLSELHERDVFERLVLMAAGAKENEALPQGLAEAADDDQQLPLFIANCIVALATAGVVAVKEAATEPFATGPDDMRGIHGEQLVESTSIRVHPMFHRALGTRG